MVHQRRVVIRRQLENECSHQAVRLEVERHNAHARGLYARAGFVRHDRDLMTWFAPSAT